MTMTFDTPCQNAAGNGHSSPTVPSYNLIWRFRYTEHQANCLWRDLKVRSNLCRSAAIWPINLSINCKNINFSMKNAQFPDNYFIAISMFNNILSRASSIMHGFFKFFLCRKDNDALCQMATDSPKICSHPNIIA